MESILIFLFLQIVLESLPVSSSGHIFIFLKLFSLNISKYSHELFDHLAHGPTALIIIVFFYKDWSGPIYRLIRFNKKESYKKLFNIFLKILSYLFIINLITALLYFVIKVLLKDFWLLQSEWSLLSGFLITAASLFSLKKLRFKNNYEPLNFNKAVVLGLVQGFALLPGISRFATTYVVGRWFCLSPRRAMQTSFLMFFPLIVGAFLKSLFKIFSDPSISLFYSLQTWLIVIIGTVAGYFALKLSYKLGVERKFWLFGFYIIFISLLLIFTVINVR